jgi:pyruvate dehydrogenase E1 component alpha subunit
MSLTLEAQHRLLREMLFARRFEERCYEAYVERRIGGFLHLYPGQEGCVHGVILSRFPESRCQRFLPA